ncbi:MAG TPA: class I SAM-dependent methyltransferase [Polyangiaceae bacterium]|jgi:2-polyprenyl-3-methyl-5-hydroxy-6-metoxy-1,4-benzoquinol methylase|nr:class I SAM-dependent methyltransferase [Polyangiaceae bacterium]
MRAYGVSGLTVVDRFGVLLSRRRIRAALRGYDSPEVLDIGCGHHATQLRDLAPRIHTGVGIESSVSDDAKAVQNLRFIEDSAEHALPTLAPASFDVVMMISVLEHVWEPLEVLRECRRVLRPTGTLVLNVPNWRGKTFLELAAFRLKVSTPEGVEDHKTYYDKRDLWPLLVRSGFMPSQIRMQYHKFGLNLFAVARMS